MANNIIVTPDRSRGDFQRIAESIASSMGLPVDAFLRQYKIMKQILKLGAYLNPATSTYTLSPRKGVDLLIPGTVLLDQNDFFAINSLGLKIGRAAFSGGIYSNHGNYPSLTYPDPAYFTGTGTSAGSEATSLLTLVNGVTSISVNNDVQMDGVLNQDLMLNPQRQYVAASLTPPQYGGWDEASRGFYDITPNLILDASADNGIVVTLSPNGARGNIDGAVSTGTTDSGVRNIVYVCLEGWKIKNLAGAGAGLTGGRTC
jgi:hypothetical protein